MWGFANTSRKLGGPPLLSCPPYQEAFSSVSNLRVRNVVERRVRFSWNLEQRYIYILWCVYLVSLLQWGAITRWMERRLINRELGSMWKSCFWPDVSFRHSPEVIRESRDKSEVTMSCQLVLMCVGYLQMTVLPPGTRCEFASCVMITGLIHLFLCIFFVEIDELIKSLSCRFYGQHVED